MGRTLQLSWQENEQFNVTGMRVPLDKGFKDCSEEMRVKEKHHISVCVDSLNSDAFQ